MLLPSLHSLYKALNRLGLIAAWLKIGNKLESIHGKTTKAVWATAHNVCQGKKGTGLKAHGERKNRGVALGPMP
jgi:hypothetical protein